MRRIALLLAVMAVAVALLVRRQSAWKGRESGEPMVVVADGGAPFDAAPGGDTSWIACGDARCAIMRESCCVYPFPVDRDPAPPALFACVAGSRCPPSTVGPHGGTGPPSALRCASTANCKRGELCCIRVTGLTISSSCVEAGECGAESEEEEQAREKKEPNGPGMHAQLCDPRAGRSSGCPASAPCTAGGAAQWQLPPTFGTCGLAEEGPF